MSDLENLKTALRSVAQTNTEVTQQDNVTCEAHFKKLITYAQELLVLCDSTFLTTTAINQVNTCLNTIEQLENKQITQHEFYNNLLETISYIQPGIIKDKINIQAAEKGLSEYFSIIVKEVKEIENIKTGLIEDSETLLSKIKYINDEADKSLLKATNASLARAYSSLQQSHRLQVWSYTGCAAISVFVLCSISWFNWNEVVNLLSQQKDFASWLQALAARFVLTSPIVWLIWFSLKRSSEHMRLQEEYAHKSAIAQSYVSFKEQIDKIKGQNSGDAESLTSQLLKSAIDAIAFNASTTLDKKHSDKKLKTQG